MYRIPPKPLRSNIAPAVLGAIISGVAGLAAGGISAGVSASNNRKQRNEQRYLQQKSIDENILQWNRENNYNTPSAQMQRFKDAGLNPNLIYGQSNTASSMTPASDVPEAKMPHNSVAEGIQSMMQMHEIQNQDKLVDSQVEFNKAKAAEATGQVDKLKQEVSNLQIQAEVLGKELGFKDEQIKNLQKVTEQVGESIKLLQTQRDTENATRREIDMRTFLGYFNAFANLQQTLAMTKYYLAQEGYYGKQKDIAAANLKLIYNNMEYSLLYGPKTIQQDYENKVLKHAQLLLQ